MREIKFELVVEGKIIGFEAFDPTLNGGAYFHVLYAEPERFCHSSVYFPPFMKMITRRQFTGLRDKNGKEIYEGDILRGCPIGYIPEKRTLGKPVEVVFIEPGKGYVSDPKCGWYIKKDNDEFSMIQVWMHVSGCGYEEVIGNRYENPEMLDEKARG